MPKLQLLIDLHNSSNLITSGSAVQTALGLEHVFRQLHSSGYMTSASLGVDFNVGQATGSILLSQATGTIGVSINGAMVGIPLTASVNDVQAASAAANVLNSATGSLVNQYVYFVPRSSSIDVYSRSPGAAGNLITIAASGSGAQVTVVGSGSRLFGGSAVTGTLKQQLFNY